MKDKLLGVGIIGTLVAALCCFTPILAWTLSTIGLSGAIGYVYRDDVLLPLMAAFLTLVYAWVKRIYVYDHVITSLHFQSFAYILGASIMYAGIPLGGSAAWAFFLLPVYLYRQLRVTYQSGRIVSGIRVFVLLLLLITCLVAVSVGASVLGYLDLN